MNRQVRMQPAIPAVPGLYKTLTDKQLRVLELVNTGRATVPEIAEKLGVSCNSIHTTLNRLRKRAELMQRCPPVTHPAPYKIDHSDPPVMTLTSPRMSRWYVVETVHGIWGPFSSRDLAVEYGSDTVVGAVREYRKEDTDTIQSHRRSVTAYTGWSADVSDLGKYAVDYSDPRTLIEVKDEIESLPEEYQDMIRMVYLEGYTTEEAATELEISEEIIQTKLTEAKKILNERNSNIPCSLDIHNLLS